MAPITVRHCLPQGDGEKAVVFAVLAEIVATNLLKNVIF